MSGFLKVKGTKIVDSNDKPVVLKGCATGGHLNMENFITGYPGHETEHKKVLELKMGKEKYDFFFEKFYDYYWTELDALFFKNELKLNCVRIPFNYRHFLNDDDDLFKINGDGFTKLNKIIDTCSKHGIYTILDLHAVPGGQNQDWHSDSSIHKALFWDFKIFQDVIINLWAEIAKYYEKNEWIAGYNPLNEPASEDHSKLIDFYVRLEKTIRSNDSNHILFLDANTYAMDFSQFPPATTFPNSVFSIHDYSNFGFPNPQGTLYAGSDSEKTKLENQYTRKIDYMIKNKVPVWNGEFGPVYASTVRGDGDPDTINKARYQLLKDQLDIYSHGDPSGDKTPISWNIWLYKDIGYQGLVYVDPESKLYQVLGHYLIRKKKLGLDRWGNDIDPKYAKLYDSLQEHFEQNIPLENQRAIYPHVWTIRDHISRVTRNLLFSQYFQYEYADLLADLTHNELDELAACFKLENMLKRDQLNEILRNY